jgi:hypothetical protein
MKNHNVETGAGYPEQPWFHVKDGVVPGIYLKGENPTRSQLVRIVTDKDEEALGYFDYAYGWVIEAIVAEKRNHGSIMMVKAWKYIELYDESWQPKPSKPKKVSASVLDEE